MDAAPTSLQELFATLPDPRGLRGQRHPLVAILNLTAVALLAGMKSLEAIAQFARDHGLPFRLALGFTRLDSPCKATLSNLFRVLDIDAYERALAAWLAARCPDLGDTLALDGKTLRGSGGYRVPGVHLLCAYAPKVAGVVGQIRVDGKTNEHKAALELLGILPLQGKVVTGDAMFCQRDVCEKVLEKGGDYLWTVKDNQPQLHYDIAAMFAASAAFSPLPATTLAVGTGPLHHAQQGARPAGTAHADGHAGAARLPGVAGHSAGLPDPSRPSVAGQDRTGNGLRDHQPGCGRGGPGASVGVVAWPLGD